MALIVGGASIVGALGLSGRFYFQVTAILVGMLLIIGAVLLFYGQRIGVAMFWLSTVVYALSQLLPALQHHGLGAFSILMGAFYLSVGFRVLLAIAAQFAIRGRHS